jgi:uncharacterized protein (TIGR02001 family)
MTILTWRRLPLACLGLFALPLAHAAESADESVDHRAAAAGPDQAWSISANAGLASQYVSRGFRQTWGNPAVQGGVDLVHRSGWSLGSWASNVSGRYIENGKLEWDLYGGYSGSLAGLGFSLTALYYKYPGAVIGATGTRFDYGELSAGLSYKSVYAKYNYTFTRDFFGIANARGTGYFDSGANLDLGHATTLNLHAGEGRVAGAGNDYWNWRDVKLGLTRTLPGGWSVAGAWTRAFGATHAYDRYSTGVPDPAGHIAYSNPAKGSVVLTLTRSF